MVQDCGVNTVDACAVRVCPRVSAQKCLNQEAQPPPPQSMLILRRVNSDSRWKAFVQTSQDSLGWVGGFENVNFYAARRWNYLLAPRSSKGRYRSPTGPLVVPVSMKTVRPRCPPGTRARRAHMARPPRRVCRFAGDPCGACAHHSRTKVTSAGGHVITSHTRPQNPFYRVKPEPEPDQTDFLGGAPRRCRRRGGQPSHV